MSRTFSKEEAQRVFAIAAERQQRTLREADEHLTLSELEESAAAAGIDPSHVRAAAELVVRPTGSTGERRILGMTVENRQSVALPFAVDDEAWATIVVELRSVFGKRGLATKMGNIREWISDAHEQRSPIRVTAESEGNTTRLTIERSTWSRTLGFGGGTLSMFVTAVLLSSIAIASGETELWVPALMMILIGSMLSAALYAGTRIAARRDAGRFDEAVRRIRQIGNQRMLDQASRAALKGDAQSGQTPSLNIDDAPEAKPIRSPGTTRQREH